MRYSLSQQPSGSGPDDSDEHDGVLMETDISPEGELSRKTELRPRGARFKSAVRGVIMEIRATYAAEHARQSVFHTSARCILGAAFVAIVAAAYLDSTLKLPYPVLSGEDSWRLFLQVLPVRLRGQTIVLERVTRSFDQAQSVLTDSINVTFALIGPSGVGKSLFLDVLRDVMGSDLIGTAIRQVAFHTPHEMFEAENWELLRMVPSLVGAVFQARLFLLLHNFPPEMLIAPESALSLRACFGIPKCYSFLSLDVGLAESNFEKNHSIASQMYHQALSAATQNVPSSLDWVRWLPFKPLADGDIKMCLESLIGEGPDLLNVGAIVDEIHSTLPVVTWNNKTVLRNGCKGVAKAMKIAMGRRLLEQI